MDAQQVQQCTRCLVVKDLGDYYPCPGYANGRYRWCKVCHNSVGKQWREKNKERQAANVKNWGIANINRRRKHRRDWQKRHRPFRSASEKIHDNVRAKVCEQLTTGKNRRKTFALLGYSVEALKNHLERNFQPGMSWDNYGEWEIDHILPRSSFSISCHEDSAFMECWALSNLQPLWSVDNRSKGNKLVWTKH